MNHTRRMNRFSIAALIGCLVATAFAATPAHAQRTWNVASGDWQTNGNWSQNAVPTSTQTASFLSTNSESASLSADATVGGIIFSNAGTKSITSNNTTARTLTIGGSGITINGGAGAVTLGDATSPLNLAIATQSWNNNSTSLFTVLGGITGTAASGTTTLTVTGTGNSLLSGVIGNGGAGGTVAFTKSGAGTVTLSGNNTYSGTTTISAGALRVTNSGGLGSTGAGTTVSSGGSLELSNNISIGAEALNLTAGSFGNSGGGSLVNVSGNNIYGGDITGGSIYSNAGKLILSGSQLGTPNDMRWAGSGDIDVTGNYAGLRNFIKFGGGTVTLSGSNTYASGQTPVILGGTVKINNANNGILGSTGQEWRIGAGTLDLNGYNATINNLQLGMRPPTMPTSFIQDNTTANVLTGSGTLSIGQVVFGASNSSYTPALVNSGAGATISGNLDLGSGPRVWDLFGTTDANAALRVSANITGSNVGVGSSSTIDRIRGIGTLVLSGSNTFTGGTRIQLGTLVLDYNTQNNSKLADAFSLQLGGLATSTLTLAGATGSHIEVVGSTAINGNDVYISRSGANTAKINLGAITAVGVLNIADGTLAQTSTVTTNGILSRVFVNGTIATKSGSDIVANTTWTDVAGGSNIANGAATNVRITSAGSNVGLAVATGTINSLTNGATSGGTTTLDLTGKTLVIAQNNGVVSGPGATAFTIQSGTLSTSAAAGTLLFAINSGNATTVSSVIANFGAGASSLIKSGTGMLVLSGNNTYTGATNLYGGTLRLDSANALPGSGSINFADRSAVLQYTSNNTTDYSARFTSPNNGAPVGIDTNGQTVTFATRVNGMVQKYGSGTLILTAANNQAVSVYEGTLRLGHATDTIGANAVEVLGGTLDVANPDTVGAVFLRSGAISGAATLIGSTYTLTDTGTISANLGSSSATLHKLGAGTAILSGANLYTGITTVTQGVLRLNSANALPGGIGASGGLSNLTINGGVVGLGNGNFARGLGAGVTQAQILDAGGGFAAYGADRTVNLGGASGAVTWGSGNFMTSSNPGNLIGSGTFVLGAADADSMVDFQNPLALTAAGVTASDWWVGTTRTIRVNNGSAAVDGRMSGAISDGWSPMGIRKTGAGTLELTAANTYTGPTTIDAGQMLFTGNGSLSGTTGAVTVNGSGAELKWNSSNALTRALVMTQGTLSGTGTISAAGGVTIGTNATLSPGNSPGTQAFTTGLTMAAGGSYLWEINDWNGTQGVDPGWDLLAVSGSPLNITASSGSPFTINLTSLTGSTAGAVANFNGDANKTFTIATAGSITGFDASAFTLNTTQFSANNTYTGSWSLTSTGNALQLNYIAPVTTTTGTYSLSASAGAATIIAGGSSTITATITNTGAGTADALNYGSLAVGQGVSISPSTGSNLAQAASGTGTGVFTTSTPGVYSFDPTATVTNATLGGAAVLSGSTATSVTVIDHATSSLSGLAVLTSSTISLGTWDYESQIWTEGDGSNLFSIFNLNPNVLDPSFVALLNLTGTSASGDSGFTLDADLNPASFAMIAGGTSASYSVSYDPTGMNTQGTFSRTFTFQMADQNLPGGQATNTLTLTAAVIVVPEPGALALAGIGIAAAACAYRRRRCG